MSPETAAGVALVGAAIGFIGALATEFLRTRAESSRAARDRRERFQVETLKRVQEVAQLHFLGLMEDYLDYKRRLAGEPSLPRLEEQRRAFEANSELSMLVWRIHDRWVLEIAMEFVAIGRLMREPRDLEELEEAWTTIGHCYQGVQDLAGREIVRILDGGKVTPRSWRPEYPPRKESDGPPSHASE